MNKPTHFRKRTTAFNAWEIGVKKPNRKRRRPLSEATIRRIVNKMPGGLTAFCAQWGWLTFARRIERAHKIE